MFKPIKAKKNSEEIIEQIKKLIISGELTPGDKLPPERDLAELFEVSRTSVREALSALETMGIISIHPGEGSFVKQASYEMFFQQMSFLMQMDSEGDISHLLEVRKILEVETSALAAARATSRDLEAIKQSLFDMDKEVTSGGIGEQGDLSFHMSVARATNNPIWVLLMTTISDILGKNLKVVREKLFLIEDMPMLLNESHRKIYEALEKKDSRLSRKRMKEHLELVEKSLLLIKNNKASKTVAQNFLEVLNLPNAKYVFPS